MHVRRSYAIEIILAMCESVVNHNEIIVDTSLSLPKKSIQTSGEHEDDEEICFFFLLFSFYVDYVTTSRGIHELSDAFFHFFVFSRSIWPLFGVSLNRIQCFMPRISQFCAHCCGWIRWTHYRNWREQKSSIKSHYWNWIIHWRCSTREIDEIEKKNTQVRKVAESRLEPKIDNLANWSGQ